MNPVKAGAIALAVLAPLAVWQSSRADRSERRLALASIRAELESLPRSEVERLAVLQRGRLLRETEPDRLFRGATLVFLAHSLSSDLAAPTAPRDARLPLAEGYEAARRLLPSTGFEGGRIRALYEARSGKERDVMPLLAQIVARSPTDDLALRAYIGGLRIGGSDERRKAVELARGYARRTGGSNAARLTLLLALSSKLAPPPSSGVRPAADPRDRDEARALASVLMRETPRDSLARGQVEALGREFATR